MYRDGLRVLPYGRSDADFFDIEERRGRHAGREFWAHKRTFGRVAFTRESNPNLQDKAGREGLIDNRASRELKINVTNVLMEYARRFFGSDSDYRAELMPGIMAHNERAQKAADTALKRRRRNLNNFLKVNKDCIREACDDASLLKGKIEDAVKSSDSGTVYVLAGQTESLEKKRNELRPLPQPAKLGDIEERYRDYRDAYNELCATMEAIQKIISKFAEDNFVNRH